MKNTQAVGAKAHERVEILLTALHAKQHLAFLKIVLCRKEHQVVWSSKQFAVVEFIC